MRALKIVVLLMLGVSTFAVGQSSTPVTIVQDDNTFTLHNAFVTAKISKSTGDMVSLKYGDVETQGFVSGHHAGYWEQNPAGAARHEAKLTIDPAANGGERGEVSVKGWSDGKNLNGERGGVRDPAMEVPDDQRPPAAGPVPGVVANRGTATGRRPGGAGGGRGPGLLVDMEIRYTLGKDDHGIYTYAIFTHPASYGATQIGESRYGMKLNGKLFDWLSIDAQRNLPMPNGYDWDHATDLNMKEARRLTTGVAKGRAEHKYDYSADQFETPAFGWSSTKQHVGIFFLNPSMEFLSSGPLHHELTGHLDDGDGGDPTLLDYWRGTHYGGSSLPIAAGEEWNKVVGPIMVYLPSGANPDAMFADAKAQAKRESAAWPYAWVNGVDYPQAAQRATVTGRMVLNDPLNPSNSLPTKELPNLLVGLAYPDAPESDSPDPRGWGGRLTWQSDAKHYEFWVHGGADGSFTIPKVRPGTYQLHAIADGVLGEYAGKATVTVPAGGGAVRLGEIVWKPVRYGKQLWQIGIANRSAREFLKGDDHWHWGMYLEYSRLFPKDVDFTVGKSDFRKDWYIYQVPRADLHNAENLIGKGQGSATTWTVRFDVPAGTPLGGQAILRVGIAAASTRGVDVQVNGKGTGGIGGLQYNATINRDGVTGSWVERDVAFDAKLLKVGANLLTLTVPAGGLTSGVAYDVLRLEVTP